MKKVFLALLISVVVALACESPPSQGEQLYNFYCANCHMPEGTGLVELIPPVAESDYLEKNWDHLACIIRKGQAETLIVNGVRYTEPMPGNEELTQTEIINIISYIREQWYPDIIAQSPADIRAFLEDCKIDNQ